MPDEESAAKRARTEAREDALGRIAELEAERDLWKSKALGAGPAFPATHWPESKPSLCSRPAYPACDALKPKEAFLLVGDILIDEACEELAKGYELPEREVGWVRRMLKYNVCGGKMNRGLMVVESGKLIFQAKGIAMTNEKIVKLAILGWCVEWMQGMLLIADDMMDDSKTRRGQTCWYLLEDVRKIALNDAFLIEALVYKVLKRHFSSEPCHGQLVDLFLETSLQTESGQLLDVLCSNLGLGDLSEPRWALMAKYKTSIYSFYVPVALGMILAGITDVKEFNACREILIAMGVYFQAQDDYLDCFGTPEKTGKIGTDIQDKKCGWLFVQAYHKLARAEQKTLLDKLYGKCKAQTPEEQQIKDLYAQLKLPELYRKYEQDSYDRIMALKDTTKEVPWAVFEMFLGKIFKRQK